jgi:hypothetical protein
MLFITLLCQDEVPVFCSASQLIRAHLLLASQVIRAHLLLALAARIRAHLLLQLRSSSVLVCSALHLIFMHLKNVQGRKKWRLQFGYLLGGC